MDENENKIEFVKLDPSKNIEISKAHLKVQQAEVLTFKKVEVEKKPLPQLTTTQKTVDPITPETLEKSVQQRMKKFFDDIPFQVTPQQQQQLLDQMMFLLLQMGSSQEFLSKGKIDERKLASINQHDLLALGHFNYRGEVDGVRYFQKFVSWVLNASVSVDNLRSRQFIQLASAMGGGSPQEIVRKPNMIGRLRNPNWRRDAEERGAIIVE